MSDAVRVGYKLTEVGVVPEDWEVKQLSECTERVVVGIASAASHAYRETGIPMLRNQNIKYGYLDESDIIYLDPNYEKTFRNKRLKLGDLITARTGYPGATCVVTENFVGAQCFTSLICTPNSIVCSDFLSIYINSEAGRNYITIAQIGGAQQNVNSGALKKMPIVIPPLPEQRTIASTLADIDALLDSLEKLFTKKRQLKQAAMQELLTGKTRLEGFEGEWEEKRLGDIAEIRMGRTPSRIVSRFWGSGCKWISIADMGSKVVKSTKEEITIEAAVLMNVIPKGTLIMSFKLSLGKLAFTGEDMYSNEAICSFNKLKAESVYLYYQMQRVNFADYGKQAVKGYTLNKESLNSIVVSFPSLPEQKAIAAILSEMDAELEALEERVTKIRDLKQGMMQELLTGRTRLV